MLRSKRVIWERREENLNGLGERPGAKRSKKKIDLSKKVKEEGLLGKRRDLRREPSKARVACHVQEEILKKNHWRAFAYYLARRGKKKGPVGVGGSYLM